MHFSNNTHPPPHSPQHPTTGHLNEPIMKQAQSEPHYCVFPQNPDSVRPPTSRSPELIHPTNQALLGSAGYMERV